MLIGLLSDTHIPETTLYIPTQVREIFSGVDLILHAGDLYTVWVLDELENIAPVLAAQGDVEYPDTEHDERIKEKHVITVDGVTIWLKHVVYWWPDEPGQVTNPASSEYEKLPDIVVHGHTHKATMERKGGTLLINPGSATFPHYVRQLGTVGLLSINSGKAEAQIIQLK